MSDGNKRKYTNKNIRESQLGERSYPYRHIQVQPNACCSRSKIIEAVERFFGCLRFEEGRIKVELPTMTGQ